MKTLHQKKSKKPKKIALTAGSFLLLGACASGPNSRVCSFDDRLPVAERLLCSNMKYDYDRNGYIKPSREDDLTNIPVPSLRSLRGYIMIPPGVDQQNLRACAQKFRETGKIDCGEFNAGE